MKGHCVEVSEALGDEEYRWALDGWRYAIVTNLLGNTDPCHYKPVPEKRRNIAPLAVTKVTMLDPFLWVLRGSGKNGAMWLAETPQGLWGVDAGLYFLFIALNGEGSLFMRMKLKGWISNVQVLRLLEKDERHIQCSSLIHAICVFYCLPITAMWMYLLLYVFCLFLKDTLMYQSLLYECSYRPIWMQPW